VSGSTLAKISAAVAAEEVLRVLQTYYGLSGTLHTITGERDQNFRLDETGGERFIVKVAHEDESPAMLELQSAVIAHIHNRAPHIPLSLEISNRAGGTLTAAVFADGKERYVRVNSFVPGLAMCDVERNTLTRQNIGWLTADLAVALQDFHFDCVQSSLLWDIQQAAALIPHLQWLTPDKRLVVEKVLQRFLIDVLPLSQTFRRGFIHNDLNLHNLFVDAKDLVRISGVIDFGDMVKAPLVNDLAIATAYQFDPAQPLQSILEVARAYHAVFPLRALEVEHLSTLVAMRFVLTVVITQWRSQLHPENAAYILRNAPAVWAGLQALHDISCASARDYLNDHLTPKPGNAT
jgi:hydroxylysine kinase